MSLTFESIPERLSPLNNITCLVSSDNTGLANFSYIFELYASDGLTLLARVKKYPDPVSAYGIMPVQQILAGYLSHDLSLDAGPRHNENSYTGYVMKVYEQYGDTPEKQEASLITDTLRYAWNARLGHLQYLDFVLDDYRMAPVESGTAETKFLTLAPRTQKIYPDESAWLYYISDGELWPSFAADSIELKINYTGGATAAFNIANTMVVHRHVRIPGGPANLTGHGTVTAADWEDAVSYELYLKDAGGHRISEIMTYEIKTKGAKYDTYRLHFLNRLGGFDSFTFTMKSRESYKIGRSAYRKMHESLTGATYGYSADSAGSIPFHITEQPILQLSGDWITDAEAAWLLDLLSSPAIYLEQDSLLIPMLMETNTYTIRKRAVDKLSNIELNLKYAFTNTRI